MFGPVTHIGLNGEMLATIKITTLQNLRESSQATRGQKWICSPLSLGSYSVTYPIDAVGHWLLGPVQAAHVS